MNTKNTILGLTLALVALVALACGAPEDFEPEGEELGTLEQALYWPDGFGFEQGNYGQCWDQTNCYFPDWKTVTWDFWDHTCPAWWRTQIEESIQDWQGIAQPLGWPLPHTNTVPMIIIVCGDAGPGNAAAFLPMGIAGPYGVNNYTFDGGQVWIDTAEIQAHSSWAGKTDVQRQRRARNITLHELMHALGLGHVGGGNYLMANGVFNNQYYALYGTTQGENNWLADFEQ